MRVFTRDLLATWACLAGVVVTGCASGSSTSASNASQITGYQPTASSSGGEPTSEATEDDGSGGSDDPTTGGTDPTTGEPTTDDPTESTTTDEPTTSDDPTTAGETTGPAPACANALMTASDALDTIGGWTHDKMDGASANWTFDHWEHGVPSSGPGACFDGGSCWATNLDDNYISCQRAFLKSPNYDLSACASESDVYVVVRHYYDFWSGDWNGQTWYDGGLIEFSGDGGESWEAAPGVNYPGTIAINPDMGAFYECVNADGFYAHQRPGFVGTNDGWEELAIAIPAHLRTSQLSLRFVYASGVSYQTSNEQQTMQHTRPGWYVDAVDWVASYP